MLKVNFETKYKMNNNVIENYSKLKLSLFLLPLFILTSIALFLYIHDGFSIENYIKIQKDWFYFINAKLSQFPELIYNLTQIGDALVILSLLSIFIIYTPKLWEALLSASIVSALFSPIFKKLFEVPRPAAIFDNNSFTIIGKTLTGHNSLPSGHSITVFTVLIVLLFSFMPKKISSKVLWIVLIISIGLLLVFTRVGVGAHYPLDTIIGGTIGFIAGISGIFISRKYKIWDWIDTKKYYPVFILLFSVCAIVLVNKIVKENLIIFYLAILSLMISLYKIIYVYTKK